MPISEQTWVSVSEFAISPDGCQVNEQNPVRMATHGDDPYGPQGSGVWHTVDVVPYGVPADAKFVFLSGLILISNANITPAKTPNLDFHVRAYGSSEETNKIGQAAKHIGKGPARSTMATWVPLGSGKFQFKYVLSTSRLYPFTEYGLNLSLQAWAR